MNSNYCDYDIDGKCAISDNKCYLKKWESTKDCDLIRHLKKDLKIKLEERVNKNL